MTNKLTQLRIRKVEKVSWQPQAEIDVPVEDRLVSFAFPEFGPAFYIEVGRQILQANLRLPTAGETAYFLDAVYNPDGELNNSPEFQRVRELMRTRWLSVFNRNLWTDKGVYVFHDTKAVGRSQSLTIEELESKLQGAETFQGVKLNPEKRIAFAPKNTYKLGEHTPESLAQDGFVLASYFPKGAEKLARVSTRFRNQPITWGLDIQKNREPFQRLSAVGDFDDRLDVAGSYFYGGYGNCAFGVKK